MKTYTARWIFPVDQHPLANGTITLQGDRILAVDKVGTRSADVDLGNVAILPGFVNAHSHLDLSDALGQCPPNSDFTIWLRAVIAHRRRQTPDEVAKAIDIGLSQCLRYGTTMVGDIAAGGISWQRLASAPLRAVVFYEMLGLTEERARQTMADAENWLKKHPDMATCRAGLSPHAPYSVRASLWSEVRARFPGLTAIHIAETEAELELLRRHEGPFVPFLKEMGVWDPTGLMESPEVVLKDSAHVLFIHGNYLSPGHVAGVEVLRNPGTQQRPDANRGFGVPQPRPPRVGQGALVYCPRTHAAFGHPDHPFRGFLAKGNRVAIGTDSMASNPDLDVLAEVRFLHAKYPDFPGKTLLEMATIQGARALQWDDEAGSLTVGKSADMVILPLPNIETDDPYQLILESELAVQSVLFRGEIVYPSKPEA